MRNSITNHLKGNEPRTVPSSTIVCYPQKFRSDPQGPCPCNGRKKRFSWRHEMWLFLLPQHIVRREEVDSFILWPLLFKKHDTGLLDRDVRSTRVGCHRLL